MVKKLKELRKGLKDWQKTLKPDHYQLNYAKRTLDLLDWIEEKRCLSHLESVFRRVVKRKIENLTHIIAVNARQIGKVTWCVLGDEDTGFYHARASARNRKNQIGRIEENNNTYFTHNEKHGILTACYKGILGVSSRTQRLIELEELYPNPLHLSSLSRPFTHEEIKETVMEIGKNKSPGPDGFGTGFYKTAWDTVNNDIYAYFEEFYQGTLELERNNRSYIVLIKKKDNASTPNDFRPISLLNCPVKFLTKALAMRFQEMTPQLIDQNQTGFIKKRGLTDSFIYAQDIVQQCKKLSKKAIVLKLDFKKAFDTVSWTCLQEILRIRGFDDRWQGWINSLLTSAKTSILLNGIPGPWIQIKRGLRQGDPLSPLLFLLIADILQKLIQKFTSEGLLKHPISSENNCPVMQYADDILIVVEGTLIQAQILREVLNAFAVTTGLQLNYSKSTFVPIALTDDEQNQISSVLGCSVAAFPQTYLGLPLTDSTLPRAAMTPILDKIDARVDTMTIKGATKGGRLTLTK